MHLPLLRDLLVLLSFSVAIVFLLQRLKLPSILGFLATGIVIGPYGLGLVRAVGEVEIISEIGVILLMFVIGMEMSVKQLVNIKKTVFVGGFLQVGVTVGIVSLAYFYYRGNWSEAVFTGFLFSLSSTAIVLKVLQDRNEIVTPHGRNALGILIFQDIIVVPMMLITPIMAGHGGDLGNSIVSLVLKFAIVIIFTFVSARYIVPKLMHAVAATQSKELFLLTTITICFAVAFLTSEAGLSLALGAFLAGLIISESEYSHQATSLILPFRELFTSFFFISVGMLLNLGFFLQHIGIVLLLVFLVFLAKTLITSIAVIVLRYPLKTVLLTALSLFQVGEFAFILSKVGIEHGLLTATQNQYFLSVSICTMLLTPFVIQYSGKIADWLIRKRIAQPFDPFVGLEKELNEGFEENLENHLIIIGYGINGSNLAKAAEFSRIPYVVIEYNAETVRREKAQGVPILFGDAAQAHILHHVNVQKARAVVVAISDLSATKMVVTSLRSLSNSVYLLVRTRYVKEIGELKALGANEVIPEEFETSVEIFSKVLENFLVPEDDIGQFIELIRADNYHLFQSEQKRHRALQAPAIPDFNITCLRVNTDSGKILGRPVRELDLIAGFGIHLLSISRKGDILSQNLQDAELKQGDVIFVQGKPGDIEKFHRQIS